MKYVRTCPRCNKEIEHKNKRSCQKGISKNLACRSCVMANNSRGAKRNFEDMRRPQVNLSERVFNNWRVLGLSHRENGGMWYWDIECTNCGYKTKRFTHYVKESKGCVKCQLKAKGEAGLNKVMGCYKDSAKNRNLSFELSKEQFRKLTSSPCHYCGCGPSITKCTNGWGDYVFNGIDRLDNSKGYVVENCVACCRTCNRGKGAWSYDFWVSHIKRLAENVVFGKVPCLVTPAQTGAKEDKKRMW